jgi:hypothetical protein
MPLKVICPKCQKEFTIPLEHGDVWQICPYCSEVNAAALVRKGAEPSCLGAALFVFGSFVVILGTYLCALGIQFSNRSQILTLIWAVSSVAVLLIIARVVSGRGAFNEATPRWGRSGVYLVMLLAAICGWIFVFATCTGGFG